MRFPSAALKAALVFNQCRETPARTRNWFALDSLGFPDHNFRSGGDMRVGGSKGD
ncbi:MAG: hypothetical protein ABIW76_14735 [Fibrobacteria bacterium]